MNDRPLVIFHGNCADGYGSAWVVRKYYQKFNQECDFFPGIYNQASPDVKGREVFIVDFSYKRPVMEHIISEARFTTIIDHHRTAIDDLKGIEHLDNVLAVFDTNRSGAGLTWDTLFLDAPRPTLINHIEDRDLWRFELPHTKEIQAAVFSYPYYFNAWDLLIEKAETAEGLKSLIVEGTALMRKHMKDIRELLPIVTRRMVIGGHNVPVANLPYIFSSEAGHILCDKEPFGACYWDTPEGRVFSFRSTDAGVDVSEIAKNLGGGGHRNASGAKVSYEFAATFEVS